MLLSFDKTLRCPVERRHHAQTQCLLQARSAHKYSLAVVKSRRQRLSAAMGLHNLARAANQARFCSGEAKRANFSAPIFVRILSLFIVAPRAIYAIHVISFRQPDSIKPKMVASSTTTIYIDNQRRNN